MLLRLARRLQGKNPALIGTRLYERVAVERLGCDDVEARDIVRRAAADFAEWPVQRQVTFRDLVSHLIIARVATGRIDDASPILQVVEDMVPSDL